VKLTRLLFRLARLSATAGAVTSGKPKRIRRRAKNVAVGRLLARGGFWKFLYK